MLRACPGAVPGGKVPAPSQPELDAAYAKGKADAEYAHEKNRPWREMEREAAIQATEKFTAALVAEGMNLWEARLDFLIDRAPVIAAALRGEDAGHRIEGAKKALRKALDALEGAA